MQVQTGADSKIAEMNFKLQEKQLQANIELANRQQDLAHLQQVNAYHENLAKELGTPAAFSLSIALIATTAFLLISKAIRSDERVTVGKNTTAVEIARLQNRSWNEVTQIETDESKD